MSMLFESTANDIFRKFDMLLRRELGYSEFKGFCDCAGRPVSESEFSTLLTKFSSTRVQYREGNDDWTRERTTAREGGLTLEGFKQFLVAEIEACHMDEERMLSWLQALGYDQDLYSIKSRCFMLTFHSTVDLQVSVRDAV